MNLIFQIFLIVLLILLNGYFSLSEIALLSAKKSKLRHLSKQGNKNAQLALSLIRRAPEMLSAVQIGITSIGIFAGALSGATLAEYLEPYLLRFSATAPYSELLSVVFVVLVITYFSLVVGELVPKQLALSRPEKLSLLVSKPIYYIIKLTSPLIKILSTSTSFVLRIFGVASATEQTVTEEEIKLLIAEGAESGVFEKAEQKMVESIFHMGNKPIKYFMTPRQEVIWLDINDSLVAMKDKIVKSDRSVFPVCEGIFDNNIGVVEAKDILTYVFDNALDTVQLKDLIQPVMHIDQELPSLVAVERLKRSAINFALITDKTTKKIVGIITFNDILEAIVGELKHN